MSKLLSILDIMDYQDSDAKIKNHHSSIEQSSSVRKPLLEPSMEEVKLEVVEKNDSQNLDKTTDSLFGFFGRPLIGRLNKTYPLKSQCKARGVNFFLKKCNYAITFLFNPRT